MTQGQHTPGPCERMALSMTSGRLGETSPRMMQARSIDSERAQLLSDREELIALVNRMRLTLKVHAAQGDQRAENDIYAAVALLSRVEGR